jgi:hypothetical protein
MRLRKRKIKKKKPGRFSTWAVKHFVIAISYLLAFAFGVIITITFFLTVESKPRAKTESPHTALYPTEATKIRSLHQLLALPPGKLEKVDIGLMNLLCAQGLKGAENIDIDRHLTTLDKWAKLVKRETETRLRQFKEHPGYYDNSEPLFKMVMLVLGLREELGVHYNVENMNTPDYSDSSQIFIHGLLGDKREGTCVSLPVLCAAIGRRLGYPVKLVHTAAHSFIRWDDPKTGERFNIETSMASGTDTFPDDYYKTWPVPLTELQLKSGCYLRSLSPAEELSSFLIYRGNSLTDIGKITEAQIAFAYAYHYSPGWVNNLMPLAAAVDSQVRQLWEKDCQLMGDKKVRYCHYSGFLRKPSELAWVYPPLSPEKTPGNEIEKKRTNPRDSRVTNSNIQKRRRRRR